MALLVWIGSGAVPGGFAIVGEILDEQLCGGSDRSDDNNYWCYDPDLEE